MNRRSFFSGIAAVTLGAALNTGMLERPRDPVLEQLSNLWEQIVLEPPHEYRPLTLESMDAAWHEAERLSRYQPSGVRIRDIAAEPPP